MAEEQAIIVTFLYALPNLQQLHDLEAKLEKAINANGVGDYDGHEIAVDLSDGFLYMYGPDAEKLFDVVIPILKEMPFLNDAKVKLRFGPPEDGIDERLCLI